MAASGTPLTTANGPQSSNIQSAPNLVRFDPKAVVPSQTIYTQRNDQLIFFALSNGTNVTFRINYRWLTPEGEIKEGELDSAPFSGTGFVTVSLYEGWLLSFGARVTSGNVAGQWTYLLVQMARGSFPGPSSPLVGIIWQGNLTFNVSNGWPGMPSKDIGDGPGTLRAIVGSVPAAGAEINEVVPISRRWTLLALRAALTTSAAVANRFPGFATDDGANTYFAIHTSVAHAASILTNYQVAPGNQFYNDTNSSELIPFPSVLQLKANHHIRTVTVALQAGDQWTAPTYLIWEWGQWDL